MRGDGVKTMMRRVQTDYLQIFYYLQIIYHLQIIYYLQIIFRLSSTVNLHCGGLEAKRRETLLASVQDVVEDKW